MESADRPRFKVHRSAILSAVLYRQHLPQMASYLLALLIAVSCLALARVSEGLFRGLPYMWPFSGAIIAAVLLGRGPALFCSIISALGLDFWIFGHGHIFLDPAVVLRLSLFLLTTWIVSQIASELRTGYLQAERLKAEAERQAAARQQIVDIVSHDLRNPLASVQMYASLLLKNIDAPSMKINEVECLGGVLRSADRMRRITGDLLDASQIEMGHFSITPAPEDLASLINDALSAFHVAAHERNIKFEVKLSKPVMCFIADRARVIQAVSNLVHNAIKYSPEGGTINIAARESDGALSVSVSDQGPGISPDKIEHIFDRYWTEKDTTKQGTGLGLFIAKGIATSHGGDLSVANNPAGGAVFTLTIPPLREKGTLAA
jgi:signal transduction histidine kinase